MAEPSFHLLIWWVRAGKAERGKPHHSLSPSLYPTLIPFILRTLDFWSRALVTSRTILCTLAFSPGLPSNSSLTLSPFRGEVSRLTSSLWWSRASVSYTLSPPSCSIIFSMPKKLNLDISKFHMLGDYVGMIKSFSMTDSFTTQVVSISIGWASAPPDQ